MDPGKPGETIDFTPSQCPCPSELVPPGRPVGTDPSKEQFEEHSVLIQVDDQATYVGRMLDVILG